jgi:CBS domain containing-hemolysin-like protein
VSFIYESFFSGATLIELIPLIGTTLTIALANGLLLMVDAAFSSIPEDQVNYLAQTDNTYAKLKKFLKRREKIITSNLFVAEVVPIVGGSQLHRIQNAIVLSRPQEIIVEVVSILVIIQFAAIFKSLGYKYPKEVAVNSVFALKIISSLISPVSTLIEKLAHTIVGDLDRERFIQESILREDLERGQDLGIIDELEHGFIENAFQFSENSVASVMTFMDQIFAIHRDQLYTIDDILTQFDSAHSRVPIVSYNNLKIECSGYILTKELHLGILSVFKELPEKFTFNQLVELVKSSQFKNQINLYKASTINEGESISKVWKLFTTKQIAEKKTNYSSLALVEHQQSRQLLGIVTLTDLLQELVGEPLYDEDDVEPPKVLSLPPASVLKQ